MKKILLNLFFILLTVNILFSEVLILKNKVAKIGDEVILKSDVEKYAQLNNLDYEEAKKRLIEKAVLYNAARLYVDEPTDEDVMKLLKMDKMDYARRIGKDYKDVTDEEFLENLHYNNISILTYKSILKREIWIDRYIYSIYEKHPVKPYHASDDEAEEFIKNNPQLFEEKGGVYLSLIYFSYFDEYGKRLNNNKIEEKNQNAVKCLNELKEGKAFEDMVEVYSDDLISKNASSKGMVGFISFDDPRTLSSFSEEIIDAFEKSNAGVILKVFSTRNGLFIFKIDEKIESEKLSHKYALVKAKDFIERRYKEKKQNEIKETVVEELKRKMFCEIY